MKAQRAGGAVRSTLEFSFSTRIANALVSYGRYLRKALWPLHLAPLYPHPGTSLSGWQIARAVMLLLFITAAVMAARKRRYLAVGWFWFLGTLVPMIGLVQVGEAAMADRYAYLPFVGLFVLITWGIAEWAAARKISPPLLAVPAMIALIALAIMAHAQLDYWDDNVTLWAHAIEVTAPNFVAQDNLGGALLLRGDFDDAMPHFRLAVQINPLDPLSTLNLADYDLQRGQLESATSAFNRVLQFTSNAGLRSSALSGLAVSVPPAENQDRTAEQAYRDALELAPQNPQAWIGLGLLSQKSGDFKRAIDHFARAIEVQPTVVEYLLLADSLRHLGRTTEAPGASQAAQQISGDFTAAEQEAEKLLAQ